LEIGTSTAKTQTVEKFVRASEGFKLALTAVENPQPNEVR